MNRWEALEQANKIVQAWIDNPPKNERGYVKDGYSTPTLEQRTGAVIQLAEFLLVADQPSKLTAPSDEYSIYGWSPGGRKPTLGQYQAAVAWRDSPLRSDRLIPAAMAGAVNDLIEAYEAPHVHRASCYGAIGEQQCDGKD
jgi:hypothetical protein